MLPFTRTGLGVYVRAMSRTARVPPGASSRRASARRATRPARGACGGKNNKRRDKRTLGLGDRKSNNKKKFRKEVGGKSFSSTSLSSTFCFLLSFVAHTSWSTNCRHTTSKVPAGNAVASAFASTYCTRPVRKVGGRSLTASAAAEKAVATPSISDEKSTPNTCAASTRNKKGERGYLGAIQSRSEGEHAVAENKEG